MREYIGMWLSLVERVVRDDEVAGSNPVIPTNFLATSLKRQVSSYCYPPRL